MPVRFFDSTLSGAPGLTGEAGRLLAVLKACLVDGFGAQTAAGWSLPWIDAVTNRAVFQAGAGTQADLQVQDNGESTQGFREARWRGGLSASGLNTLTGPFPTTAQVTNGVICRKSSTSDATARPWRLIADARRFFLFIQHGDTAGRFSGYFFGDVVSYKTVAAPDLDALCAGIIGRTQEGSGDSYDVFSAVSTGITGTVQSAHYLAGSYTGLGGSIQFLKVADYSLANQSQMGSTTGLAYPNGPDGGLYQARARIGHNSLVRGHLPGIWCPLHNQPLSDGDTFSGRGALAGRSFLVIALTNSAQCFIETSDTWD